MKHILLVFIFFIFSTMAHTTPTPPPASAVFTLEAHAIDPNTFALQWEVKPGFFLYRHRIKFIEQPNERFHLTAPQFPKAINKTDPKGHTVKIYRHTLTLSVNVLAESSGEGLFQVSYQGCADDGFCYPPETKQVKLSFDDKRGLIAINIEQHPIKPLAALIMTNHTESLHQLLSSHHWGLIFLSFFGFGLLLAFTPCVLPMIPVLSGIILGQNKTTSTYRSFLLSLSYVLGMAATYAMIGAIVALMGNNLQIAMQLPWVIASFSCMFILLALSMFGFYNLQLPASWQTKLSTLSHSKAGGHYVGALIMGCLSTLILSPCVTPPLVGALGYIAQTGDVLRGCFTLFFLGLGMGTPLLLIGTSAGIWVPKTGAWMNTIKAFFGLLLLAVSIDLFSRILPAIVIMGMWSSLLIFSGVYAGALSHAKSNPEKFRQSVGILSLIYGILILIGMSKGSHNPLQPLLQPISSNTSTGSIHPDARVFKTLAEVKQALILAHTKGTPAIIDFYADWCATCQQIETTTLQDPEIQTALSAFMFIKIDVTGNNQASRALFDYFNVVAPPTFIFYNANGKELNPLRLVGEISPTMLLDSMNNLLSDKT